MWKNDKTTVGHSLTTSLGWVALGIGAAELLAPKRLARLLGMRPAGWISAIVRACGLRETMSGFGLLSDKRPRFWLQVRLAGDAMDAGLLWWAIEQAPYAESTRKSRLTGALLAVGGVSLLDAVTLGLGSWVQKRTSQRSKLEKKVATSITIDRSAADVYAFLRNVENLPRFISYLESVTSADQTTSHWRAKVPHGPSFEWDASVVEEQPNKRIVWKLEFTKIPMLVDSAEVRLEAAPGGRGTEVHFTLSGKEIQAPRLVEKTMGRWLRKLPERFWSAQLRRLKQVLELGEITVSDASAFAKPHPARPAKEALTSAPLASSAAPVPGPKVVEEGRPS
jgi:uncharacterized membrane protein